jgi:hypothetical protein
MAARGLVRGWRKIVIRGDQEAEAAHEDDQTHARQTVSHQLLPPASHIAEHPPDHHQIDGQQARFVHIKESELAALQAFNPFKKHGICQNGREFSGNGAGDGAQGRASGK